MHSREMLAVLGFPTALCNGGDMCAAVNADKMQKVL